MHGRGVMEHIVGAAPQEDVNVLGAELLRQGERCALSGFPDQAEAILRQAWQLVANQSLGDQIAWQIACLRLHAQDYAAAAEWFDRISSAPAMSGPLWPGQQSGFVRLCRQLAHESNGRAASAPTIPASLQPLTITNLGSFQIMRGDEALPICRTRKAISLFRYLLSRSQLSAGREELMDVLWPASAPREATHSLHVAVSILRRHLDVGDPSYLLYASGRYTINPAAMVQDDSRMFSQASEHAEQCWRAGDLDQAQQAYVDALARYHDDYFVDDQDHDWALAEHERLLTRFLLALDRLSQIWMAQGRFEAAAECYRQLLDRDAFREDAHCQLIRCYLLLGRRGDALLQYQRCAAVLDQELGLAPMAETQELLQRINGA
jgi:DNA-binding SARP family transcriptional activator